METRTVLSGSSASSSMVARFSTVCDAPAANATLEGTVSPSTLPSSVISTFTLRPAPVLPVRVSVNASSVPSLTGVVPPAIPTTGRAGPGTECSSPPRNISPSASQTAWVAPQPVVARALSVTAPSPDGTRVSRQRWFWPCTSRLATFSVAPVTSNSPSRTDL